MTRHRLTRAAVGLLLLFAGPAAAQGPGGSDSGFDRKLAAEIFTAALTFMAPRILAPVPPPQLALWGLQGLSALDPALAPRARASELALTGPAGLLSAHAVPADDDIAGWSTLAADISAVAYDHSAALRHAGTGGIIASFFDEVFNHLDPYSRYVPPSAAVADRERRRGEAGVGAVLGGRPGGLFIAGIIAGGPAEQAGVRAGERVVAVDGAPLGRADAAAAIALIDGNPGESVTLTLRGRSGRQRHVSMIRALVPPETVFAAIDGDLLVLRLSGFSATTAARLQRELVAGLARKPRPRGVAIDLRGNRGGLLRQAVAAGDLMLADGVIARTEGRDPAANHIWRADGADLALGLPVVVLVDGRSASAAEILAAALADNGRAVVVGSATLGKGLVQTIAPMPDGGELYVTWSRVLAPAGWPLQGLGVLPQVCTSVSEDATGRQLAALSSGAQPMAAVLAAHRAARADLPVAEMLVLRDACPAAVGGDLDLKTAHGLVANASAYAAALQGRAR